jgi:PTS system ascorbate-specific IIA component
MTTQLLIIAHDPLAHALRECVLHVFPDVEDFVDAVDVPADAPVDEMVKMVQKRIEDTHTQQILILTDVFGATPCNIAQKVADGIRVKLVTGVNLPMLLRTVNYRHEGLDTLVARAVTGGTQCIMQVAVSAPQNQVKNHHDQKHHNHHQ